MGREIRLIRALADEGYQFGLNGGVPPIPRDRMVRFTSLPKHLAKRAHATRSRPAACRSIMLRGDGQMNPDGVRDYDLLVPATAEALVERAARRGARRGLRARADAWRATFIAEHGGRSRRAEPPDEGAAPAGVAGGGPGRRRGRRGDRRRARRSCSASARTTRDRPRPTWPAGSPSCASSATTRAGPTVASSTSAAARSSISQFTLYADTRRGRRPGFTGRRAPELAERLYRQFARCPARAGRDGRDRPVRRGDGRGAGQRRPVHDLAGHRRSKADAKPTRSVVSAAAAGRRRTGGSRSSRSRGRG